MDAVSMSSGCVSEAIVDRDRWKLTQEARGENELTLTRLRRLSRTVMSKNERHRFEARKLCRFNIITFLENHLMHPSEKVRYLALELFCCTIPRLANKVDSLLRPILPKVFQCLQGFEKKDMKMKALHFLRGYFRHTRNLSSFIDTYVLLGIENTDPDIQTSCCLGLNIVFDQDIGNSLYSHIVISLGSLLMQSHQHEVVRAAYRALKHIHETVGDERFSGLMNKSDEDVVEMYHSMFTVEQSESFQADIRKNCSSFISEYQLKRRNLNLNKDFGILDPVYLDEIRQTRNCDRARAICNLVSALRQTPWSEDDLDPHILDLLKMVHCFTNDSNRLIQLYGFDILKKTISRMGFTIAPSIRFVVEILRCSITSPNSKIRSKVEKILHKLMSNIHPMTVIWELLVTKKSSINEAVLIFIQGKMSAFTYYEFDLVPLCNYLGQYFECKNNKIAKCSRDCVILLLDIMRCCPVYGLRTEAVRVLLRNYKFSRDTLRDIGVLGDNEDDDDVSQDGSESFSDDDVIDVDSTSIQIDSTPTGFTLSGTHRSISTAGESETSYNQVHSDTSISKSCKTPADIGPIVYIDNTKDCNERPANEQEKNSIKLPLHSPKSSQTSLNWIGSIHSINNVTKDAPLDVINATEKRQIFSSGAESVSTILDSCKDMIMIESKTPKIRRTYSITPDCSKTVVLSDKNVAFHHSFGIRKSPEVVSDINENCRNLQAATPNIADGLPKLQTEKKTRKQLTRFHLKADSTYSTTLDNQNQDMQAGGDPISLFENSSSNLQAKLENIRNSRFITEAYEQDGIQVNIMDKNYFNFNIMQVEDDHKKDTEDIYEELESIEDYKNTKGDQNFTKIAISKIKKQDKRGRVDEIQRHTISKANSLTLNDKIELSKALPKYDSQTKCQMFVESICNDETFETDMKESVDGNDVSSHISKELMKKDSYNSPSTFFSEDQRSECLPLDLENFQQNPDANILEELESNAEVEVSYDKEFDKIETPFMPKSRQLPRTPVEKKKTCSLEIQPKSRKGCKKIFKTNKTKALIEKKRDTNMSYTNDHCEEPDKTTVMRKTVSHNDGAEMKKIGPPNHNSPSKWGGCQWRRELEYAAKAAPCPWADKFEKTVLSLKPYPSTEAAENEMKKAVEELFGKSWKEKEEAMVAVIRLAKHHPEIVQDNATKIAVALSNEIKNFRQSVAGKAVLTTGHIYELMGKSFENKLRLVVGALLGKSGNRTLAAYFRLVIKSLLKIVNATSPHKAAVAFIHEGSRHANKAARETAAQFLAILTEKMGPENSLAPPYSGHMLKCAAFFVFDSSALTRYCGKRMFKVFVKHPEFWKMKDHQLDIITAQNLSKVLDQIKDKGIAEETLPINVID